MISRKSMITSALAGTVGASCLSADVLKKVQNKSAKRIVFLSTSLGFLKQNFFPKEAGRNYQLSPYLSHFEKLRNDFTVFSGLSHEGLLGSLHQSERCLLTAAKNASSPTFKNSISLDQIISDKIGKQTRFNLLNLSLGERGLSHNRAGVMVPPVEDCRALYSALFKQKTEKEIVKAKQSLGIKSDILLSSLKHSFKQSKMMKNFEKSAHEMELSFKRESEWLDIPLPKVDEGLMFEETHDSELLKRFQNFLTTIRLAFETDSTRTAVLHIPFYNKVPMVEGVDTSWHRLTHIPLKKKPNQLVSLEDRLLKYISNFCQDLKNTKTKTGNLLDETIVFIGSNLGESNSHNPLNLPTMVVGGGFDHGQHIKYDHDNNEDLSKLFMSMANRIEGVELTDFKKEKQCLKEFI